MKTRQLLDKHYQHRDVDTAFSAQLLYYIQLSLIIFIVAAFLIVTTLYPVKSQFIYLLITFGALALLGVSMWLVLTGRYQPAFWCTMSMIFIAPWAMIFFEYIQQSGDYVPMLYLIVPIQITAMFVKVKPIYWVAVVQTALLALLLYLDSTREAYNWPGVLSFIFISSMLAAITSFVLRIQYDRLIHSRNDLVRSEQRLRDISIRDPLTGLFNRRHMDEAFAELFERASPMFSLLMVDVDHFKDINDTYGHSCGDEIIQKVAAILTTAIRKYDVACRYGGDEFLLILSDCDSENALIKAQKIKQEIENVVVDPESNVKSPLTASIGVAQCPRNGDSRDAILKAVDDALYTAKQGGRNQVVAAEGVYTAAVITPHVR